LRSLFLLFLCIFTLLAVAAPLASSLSPAASAYVTTLGGGPWEYIELMPPVNATALEIVPCVTLSQAPGGQYSQYNLTFASGVSVVITPDVWNTRSGSGEVTVRACGDGFFASIVNYNATATNVYDTVMGYPEIIYGYKPWGQVITGQSPYLQLPAKVGDLPLIVAYINYSLGFPNGRGDFSFDMWLTRSYEPSSVGANDLEIMVWFYHSPGFNPAGYSRPNATFYIPTMVDGRVVNATWQAYMALHFPWTYMAFVLTPPLGNGSIAVPLSSIFSDASLLWSQVSNYSFDQLYLNDIELGMEYSSIQWPPVDVNVSAWYKVYSYGFLVAPRQVTTVTSTTTSTTTMTSTVTSTTTQVTMLTRTTTSTATITSTIASTITSALTPTSTVTVTKRVGVGIYSVVALSLVIVLLAAALVAVLLRRGR